MENLTSVTDTHQPLPAVSKILRRFAYRYNESGIGHWLPLIFATKVNIWGRFLKSLKNSKHTPLLKYSRFHSPVSTAARILVTTFVIAAVFTAARKRKKTKTISRR